MRRSLMALMLSVAVAAPALAGTVSRGTKTISGNGGTAFVNDKPLDADELNTDFDGLVNVINGGIDNANVEDGTLTDADHAGPYSSRGTSGFYLDDLSTDIEAIMDSCKGTNASDACDADPDRNGGTPSGKATDLGEEILQLRHQLIRHSVGESMRLEANADEQDLPAWFDYPVVGPNLLRNGDFEINQTATTACPDGWTDVLGGGAPTFTTDETEASEGEGKELQVEADAAAAEQGCSQTLTGLKASTRYLFTARVKTATGTCGIETTNAINSGDFQDLDLSTTSATYTTLSGVFATDATPTAPVVSLLTNGGATDDCDFDHVGVFETGVDPAPMGGDVVYYEASTDTSVQYASGAWTAAEDSAGAAISVAVTPPSDGYVIRFDVSLCSDVNGSGGHILARILENAASVATGAAYAHAASDVACPTVTYMNASPTPGTTYTYTVEGRTEQAATGDANVTLTVQQLSTFALEMRRLR